MAMTFPTHTSTARIQTVPVSIRRRLHLPKVRRRQHDGWASLAEQRAHKLSLANVAFTPRAFG